MSTRCIIGVSMKDGRVECIYCSHNGDPAYMLPILRSRYNTQTNRQKLLESGNVDSIDANGRFTRKHKPEQSSMFASLPAFESILNKDSTWEYNYLWCNGGWHLMRNGKWYLATDPTE